MLILAYYLNIIPEHICSFFWILQKGFVQAHADDGLLEIFGLKEGWHASFVMAEIIKAKHIAQVGSFV